MSIESGAKRFYRAIGSNVIPFAELCARSNFSFLEGASHPEELVLEASRLELEALAIADRNGLYGAVRAHAEAKRLGVPFVVSAEIALDSMSSGVIPEKVVLLVQSRIGYRNLCTLLTLAHRDHEKGQASLDPAVLSLYAEGLALIAPTDHWALHDPEAWSTAFWKNLQSSFADRLHVAAYRHLDGKDVSRIEAALWIEKTLGILPIATARPLYHIASRKPLSDVIFCIREKTTLDRAGDQLCPNAEAKLRGAAEMQRLFEEHHDWIERSAEVADACRFSLDDIRYRFPSETLCHEGESPDAALRRMTYAGAEVRYSFGIPEKVRLQIEKELALIAKIQVAPYFLSVSQVVEMARRRKILCQGRGSAANSAVCFALGVTAVDPARSNLLFERFLSAERAEPPDIDVDFEHERREEVIQEIYETYGRDRSAMVSEVICYRGRSALREVGKAFGLSLDQVDRLSSIVLHYNLDEVTSGRVIEHGLDPRDGRVFKAIAIARALEGFPRHLSIHVGGFILSSESLANVAPIEPGRMKDRTVIPWDKDDIDTLGFFKVDVLGLGMLTCIRKTLALLHELGRLPRSIESNALFDPIEALASIPPEDPVVYDAICHADTVGVFQIESRAQMSMLPRLKPRTFYDLVIEVAIVRPGPIQGGMVHPYLRRRTGKEDKAAPHPCLEPILERTLGVPLFQEQVMQIAMVGAGYGPGEADQLRRDMAAWKKHGKLERHRDRLLRGFQERGVSRVFGEQLYKQIQGFGEYGFPESHAASFALLVYASSWLKTHHPAAFACGLLNAQPMGFYSPSSIVQDAQRHGVRVRSVSVMESNWDHSLEEDALSHGDRALRIGLRLVKGLGEASGLAIEAARKEKPFSSIHDLAIRTDLKKNELEALAEAGALEALSPGRRQALWDALAPRDPGLLRVAEPNAADAPRFRPHLKVEQLLLDYGRLGLSIDDHPMRHVRPHLARRRVSRARDLPGIVHGTSVRVAGLVTGRQRPQTASGITFMSLEDETGIINLIVHVKTFEQHRHTALYARLLFVSGTLERDGEVIHVVVRAMERLELPNDEPLPARSRDFH
jgi:error-prone DNA polymerase